MERDELFADAVRIVQATNRCSYLLLQRELGINFFRAQKLKTQLKQAGIIDGDNLCRIEK